MLRKNGSVAPELSTLVEDILGLIDVLIIFEHAVQDSFPQALLWPHFDGHMEQQLKLVVVDCEVVLYDINNIFSKFGGQEEGQIDKSIVIESLARRIQMSSSAIQTSIAILET